MLDSEGTFVLTRESRVPRVTRAHEQQVRDRIVAAAIGVFNEKG